MRKIKFRGKDKTNNKWIYGNLEIPLLNQNISKCYIIGHSYGQYQRHEVDPETVGQYIILEDNAKRGIFEGDIIEAHVFDAENKEKLVGKIEFNEGRGGYTFVPTNWEKKNLYYPIFAVISCNVIGNIYDNPELLK